MPPGLEHGFQVLSIPCNGKGHLHKDTILYKSCLILPVFRENPGCADTGQLQDVENQAGSMEECGHAPKNAAPATMIGEEGGFTLRLTTVARTFTII